MNKILIIATMVLIAAARVGAQGVSSAYVLTIGSGDVTTYNPIGDETSKYYKLDFDVPEVGAATMLEGAYLEFYVDAESIVQGDFHWLDADSVEHVGYQASTPLIEVCALTSPVSGALQDGQLDKATAVRRPVRVGNDRRVVINVTSIVRSFIENPSRNLGIVIGSFTGSREGEFTLKDGAFQDGGLARVTLKVRPVR